MIPNLIERMEEQQRKAHEAIAAMPEGLRRVILAEPTRPDPLRPYLFTYTF